MIKYTCGAGTPEEAEANCTYFIRGECTASFCEYRRKKQTNADRIWVMSIAELNDFLRKVADHDDDCPYEYGSVKSLEWLGKPYVQKEYKKL